MGDKTPPRISKWDPDVYPLRKFGTTHYVSDEDYQLYKKIENARKARFWSIKDFRIRKEQMQSLRGRAFGAPPLPPPAPQVLSDEVLHPMRYDLVLTDIGGIKKNNFRIAVRDRDGQLREPNEDEFKRVRFREKSA